MLIPFVSGIHSTLAPKASAINLSGTIVLPSLINGAASRGSAYAPFTFGVGLPI